MSSLFGTILLFSLVFLVIARRSRGVVVAPVESAPPPRSFNQEERLRLALLGERRAEESRNPICL